MFPLTDRRDCRTASVRRTKHLRLALTALALLSTLAGTGATAGTGQAAVAQAGDKLVLAFYYMWYLPSTFDSGQMSDRPTVPYNSSLPDVMDRQVKEARAAGIDAFIASWSGIGTDSDRNFGGLLDVAARDGFHATIYFETSSVASRGDATAQLQQALAKYAGHPGFLKWNGKPVVFFWSPGTLGNAAAWKRVRAAVDPGSSQVWSVDTTDASYLDAFDTIHFFSAGKWDASTDVARVNAQMKAAVDGYNKTHGTRRTFTPGVTPGWDESRIRPPRNPAKVIPRRDGATYEDAWKAAVGASPDWVTITSWNEWFEGSQIEPSVGYGTKYLDITGRYAAALKSGPSPCDGGTFFKETGQSICKRMEGYWRTYGGLPQFGFPISPPLSEKSGVDSKTYTVQYFERARFELHPENQAPYDVLLGLLGRQFHAVDPPVAQSAAPGTFYFDVTGHNVSPVFYAYWKDHGGLFVNGYPITEPIQERSSDGKTYTVQYFERSRFEYHPENRPPYDVLLGLLGRQAYQGK